MEVRRLRQRLNDFKTPAVLQRRNTRACADYFRRIDLGHDDPRLGATFRNDAPPRVNDQ
jgi:hypothetical protein